MSQDTKDQPMIAAATVVLVRDSAEGLQTLMLRRNAKLDFAGGNWVFPGGRIDPEDFRGGPASEQNNHDGQALEQEAGRPAGEYNAALNAAVRETKEEADLNIDVPGLNYFSHWVAPPLMKKRFSTWFFIATLDETKTHSVTVDGGEIHESQWLTPAQALQNAEQKTMNLLPPTLVTLHEMARYATVNDVLGYYQQREPRVYQPRVFMGEADTPTAGQFVFLYQGDAGYPTTDPAIEGERHRLSSIDGQWRYENSRDPV